MFKAVLILLFVASCQSLPALPAMEKGLRKPIINFGGIGNPIASLFGAPTESTGPTSEEPVNPLLPGLQNILKLTVALQNELAHHNLNPIQQALAIQALMLPPGLMAAMMPPQLLPQSPSQTPQSPRQAPITAGGIINPPNGLNNVLTTFLGNSPIGTILTGMNPLGSITAALGTGSTQPIGSYFNNLLPIDNILKGIYGLNLSQIAQLIGGGGIANGAGGIGSVIGTGIGAIPADTLGGQTTSPTTTTKAPTV